MQVYAALGFMRRHYVEASQGKFFAQSTELRNLEDLAKMSLDDAQPSAAAVTAATHKLATELLVTRQAEKALM